MEQDQRYADIAASLQKVTEEILLHGACRHIPGRQQTPRDGRRGCVELPSQWQDSGRSRHRRTLCPTRGGGRWCGIGRRQPVQVDVQFPTLALNDLAVRYLGRVCCAPSIRLQLVKEPCRQIVAVVDRPIGSDR
jgi:hypothetical protein